MPFEKHVIRNATLGTLLGCLVLSLAQGLFEPSSMRWGWFGALGSAPFPAGRSDVANATFFLVFLVAFVLIGLSPAFQRAFPKILEMFRLLGAPRGGGGAGPGGGLDEPLEGWHGAGPLNDFEILVFRRIAQAGGKGMTPKSLVDTLHMDPVIIKKTLGTLHAKGLVRFRKAYLLGKVFYLTGEGLDYAVEQGVLPHLRLPS